MYLRSFDNNTVIEKVMHEKFPNIFFEILKYFIFLCVFVTEKLEHDI